MTRPTKEDVDEALRWVHAGTDPDYPESHGTVTAEDYASDADGYHQVLAAEVLALRADLQLFREAGEAAELRIVQLREELAVCHAMVKRDAEVFAALPRYSTEAVDALLSEIAAGYVESDHWGALNRAAEAVRASREPPYESRAAKEQREGMTGPARFTASDGAVSTQPKPPLKA